MAEMAETLDLVRALYSDFFERGVRYFFPDGALSAEGRTAEMQPTLRFHSRTDGALDLEWMGTVYHFERGGGRPFTEDQVRLVGGIGAVLSARYRSLFVGGAAAATFGLFAGLPEDRYVSAFLDHFPYLDEDTVPEGRDVVADPTQALRGSDPFTR